MSHFNSSHTTSATADKSSERKDSATMDNAKAYEAPTIETILTPDDLQREVLYAAFTDDGSNPPIP